MNNLKNKIMDALCGFIVIITLIYEAYIPNHILINIKKTYNKIYFADFIIIITFMFCLYIICKILLSTMGELFYIMILSIMLVCIKNYLKL